MDPISLNPYSNMMPGQGDQLISLDSGTAPNIIPNPQEAQTKAAKAHVAVGDIMKTTSQNDMFNSIMNGQEKEFRQQAASAVDISNYQDKQIALKQAVNNPNVNVSDLLAFTSRPMADPKSVIEDQYAKNFTSPMTNMADPFNFGTFMPQAMKVMPAVVQDIKQQADDILSFKEYVGNRTSQSQQLVHQQSWLGYGVDWAKQQIQLYNEFKLRGWTGKMDWSSLLGTALSNEQEDLMRMPSGERRQKFDQIMSSLEKDNPSMAVMFGSAMESMSLDKIDAIDTSSAIGLAMPLVGGIGPKVLKGMVKGAVIDAAKASDLVNVGHKFDVASLPGFYSQSAITDMGARLQGLTTQDIKAASAAGQGNMAEAAVQKTARDLALGQQGNINPENAATEPMMTYLRSDANHVRTDPARAGQEIKNRIYEDTINSERSLEATVGHMIRVQRTPILVADENVARLAQSQIRRKYSGPNSAILDVGDPIWHPDSNTYHADVAIGTHDAEYFKDEAGARSFAETYGLGGNNVYERRGVGWYIKSTVPIDETQDGIRDALIKMPGAWAGSAHVAERSGTQIPYMIDPVTGKPSTRVWDILQAYTNSGAGLFDYRSPEETLSPVENEQRKIATFGAGRLMEMFQDNNAIIKDGNTSEFKRLLVRAQNEPDPITKEQGVFYRGLNEFETAFQNVNNRTPTDKEYRAYFAFKNNYEMERSIRSLALIRNKSRLGVMEYQIRRPMEDGKTLNSSPWFDAMPMDELPKTSDPVYIATTGRHTTLNAAKINSAIRSDLEKGIAEGRYKVLKMWDRNLKSLNDWSEGKINPESQPLYVVTDNTNFRPLSPENQISRRGGGHWIFEYDHYLKQADVYYDPITEQHVYRGDTTLMPFQLRALGDKVADHFNNIRQFIKNKDETGARNYTQTMGVAGLDFDRDIKPMFEAHRGPGGEYIPARFNTEEPFKMVSANKRIIDIDDSMHRKYGDKFLDGTRYSNPAQQFQVEFTGQRDAWNLHTIEDKGSWNNPIYQYRPAKLMDPIDALNRSMAKISNSTFMDDYKYMATEHWLQTFTPWLDAGSPDEIKHAPFYYFQKGEFRKDAPANIRLLGESNRKKIQDFIGQPSVMKNAINDLASRTFDALYKKGIPDKYIPYEKLGLSKDPVGAVRSMIADMKLGLFSVPAFFMQASAFSNVAAINPRQAAAATLGALMHEWSRAMPQHLDHLDSIASTRMLNWLPGMSKWAPGELKEANLLAQKTGFMTVGSEHAMFDSMLKDRGVGTAFDTIRYWGRTAFREGAQFVRYAAWYSAYREFRDAKAAGALTRADESWILNRAALLDHDMNRASNSALNTGLASLPTQFYNYARNLAEDMYGKRLTWQEKARLFAMNGALWGIPAGAVGLYGLPLGDTLRKYSEKYLKYVPGYNLGESIAMDGVMSALGAYITGHRDTQAGIWYDTSKFGVKGWDFINNFIETDKTIWDFIGGATYSTAKNTIFRANPFLHDMYYLMTGHPDKFPVLGQDIADLFKEISSVSYNWKMLTALHTHIWMSNNNTPLDSNVSAVDAITRAVTGLVPVNVSDITINRNIQNDRESMIKDYTGRVARNMNIALVSAKNNDWDGYEKAMTKANTYLMAMNLPPKERIRIIHEIASRREDLVQSIDWQLSTKNVPESEIQSETQRYLQSEQLRRKRQGLQ